MRKHHYVYDVELNIPLVLNGMCSEEFVSIYPYTNVENNLPVRLPLLAANLKQRIQKISCF